MAPNKKTLVARTLQEEADRALEAFAPDNVDREVDESGDEDALVGQKNLPKSITQRGATRALGSFLCSQEEMQWKQDCHSITTSCRQFRELSVIVVAVCGKYLLQMEKAKYCQRNIGRASQVPARSRAIGLC